MKYKKGLFGDKEVRNFLNHFNSHIIRKLRRK